MPIIFNPFSGTFEIVPNTQPTNISGGVAYGIWDSLDGGVPSSTYASAPVDGGTV